MARRRMKPSANVQHQRMRERRPAAEEASKVAVSGRVLWMVCLTVALSAVLVMKVARPTSPTNVAEETAVLVIAHSRDAYLARALWSILKHHPRQSRASFPLFISQDDQDPNASFPLVAETVARAMENERFVNITHMVHRPNNAALEEPRGKGGVFINHVGYRRISRHYHWAISQVFGHLRGFSRIIILEDDLEIAPDFFEYFSALAPVLDSDPSLLTVSAWNDNGKPDLVDDPTQLHRSDWFPGLGWMLRRELWESELASKWPDAFWDDWMRDPAQLEGRQSIRPEVSRTSNFGASGISKGADFTNHIGSVSLNEKFIPFTKLDLGYLKAKEYEVFLFERVSNATLLRFTNYLKHVRPGEDAIIQYLPGKFDAMAKKFGMMSDHRHGVWRTSYRGILTVKNSGRWLFFFPKGSSSIIPNGYRLGKSECC